MASDAIRVTGAREHNLQNINIEIPRDKFVVITGLSGSGKSSLAFDTIYAEGQRRYVESLSSYARQFLGQMEKPDVDQIDGLSPAISIDQKSASRNPRSTVATVTEIYDYLRLLYARIGVPHCPICGRAVHRRTPQAIIDEILQLDGARVYIGAPLAKAKKGEFAHIPEQYLAKGFARARVDGVIYALDEWPSLDKNYKHDVELIVDRLVISQDAISRITQSVETALELGAGTVEVYVVDDARADLPAGAVDFRDESVSSRISGSPSTSSATRNSNHETASGKSKRQQSNQPSLYVYSTSYACTVHPDEPILELEPRLFSFNAPFGACPTCTGLGTRLEVDPDLVLNPNLTIAEGAIRPYNRMNTDAWWLKKLAAVGEAHGFDVRMPVKDLDAEVVQKVLYGTGTQKYTVQLGNGREYDTTYEGVIPNLERRWRETDSDWARRDIERLCASANARPVTARG
ncbi:hypothetical protein FACS189431_1350 [Alphaproteobacteria bacterium]|nr:hypothetical protein FACS189431_1350 [Alphaproteobacteria bacterium]